LVIRDEPVAHPRHGVRPGVATGHLDGRASGAGSIGVLESQPGTPARRIGHRLRDHRPALAFVVATLLGYFLLASFAIGLGLFLVDVALPIHSVGYADEWLAEWLAARRTGSLNDASYVGSAVGDMPAIPGLVALTAIGAAALRRWRVAAFFVGAILVEVATYRIASLVVHRDRPAVLRLDQLPVNQSYPSGHVAASVVVYVGLALLISSRLRRRWVTITVWTLAVVLPLVVAWSRMYRGMHHPLDVIAGALIGLLSIGVALLAARACGEALRLRNSSNGSGRA
jgi:membrane-associated phospholipid phosphatase